MKYYTFKLTDIRKKTFICIILDTNLDNAWKSVLIKMLEKIDACIKIKLISTDDENIT